MFTKIVASLGLAAAGTAGAALFMGSPASAETLPASAQTTVAHVQTTVRHDGDDRGWTTGRGWTNDRYDRGWIDDRYDRRWPHEWTWYHHRHHHRHHHGRHHGVVVVVRGDHWR